MGSLCPSVPNFSLSKMQQLIFSPRNRKTTLHIDFSLASLLSLESAVRKSSLQNLSLSFSLKSKKLCQCIFPVSSLKVLKSLTPLLRTTLSTLSEQPQSTSMLVKCFFPYSHTQLQLPLQIRIDISPVLGLNPL